MTALSHRERVIKALNHEEPDRVPMDFGSTYVTTININAYPLLVEHLGLADEPGAAVMRKRSQVATPSEAILQRLDVDLRSLWFGPPDDNREETMDEHSFRDEFGVLWTKPEAGHYINVSGPFQQGEPTLADLERNPWPNPRDPGRIRGMLERARHLHQETDYAVLLNLPHGIVGDCERLRGFGEFLSDLLVNAAFAEGLMAHVLEVTAGLAVAALEVVGEYVDVVMYPDDLGMQDMCLVRPELYRRLIKPYHRRLVEAIKSKTRAKVVMHSDGSVYPLIPDLIDIGVDALNPVQVSAKDMDSRRLKAEFGDSLTFWGGIDTHHVLPRGTPEDVRNEVRTRIRDLAPGGGYVLASVHNVQAEVPPENVVAMFDAALEYGRYQEPIWR